MRYSDIGKGKSATVSENRFLKILGIKLGCSVAVGLGVAIFGCAKFDFRFLPVFKLVSVLVAATLVVIVPFVKWRRRMGNRLLTYTVIDIETTGLKPQNSEITELAALRVREGVVVDRFQELVAVNGDIPKVVVEKTGITKEMLAGARSVKAVLKDFVKFVGNDALVGYNLDSFDIPFINFHAARQIKRTLGNPTVDVWKLAKLKCPDLGCYKLDSLRMQYGISGSGAHRALKDCEDTNEVYRALASAKQPKYPRAATTVKLNLKSIFRMSESDLKTRFGADWQIAQELIASKKQRIESGLDQDWEMVREGWDSSMRATQAQIAMLEGLGAQSPELLSKSDASLMIEVLMLESDVKREATRRAAKAHKEAEKAARAAAKEARKAECEARRAEREAAKAERAEALAVKKAAREAELEHYDGPRMSISPQCAAKWRDEFMSLWNGILADDVIEVRELIDLKGWLNRHKRRRDDFHAMLKLIDDVVADGVVDADETQRLYAAAVEVLDGLAADADETTPVPVEAPKNYKTEAIRKIADEIGSLFHPEYPFLDADYSPSTQMPVCDLTSYVSELYANSDKDALRELWTFIGDDAERVLLEKALCIDPPEGLGISEFAKAELWAINALASRMSVSKGANHAMFASMGMLATTLSTRTFTMNDDLKSYVEDTMRLELTHLKKEGLLVGEVEEVIKKNLSAVDAGTHCCEGFANLMKSVNPAARIVIADSCLADQGSDYSRKLHFGLGYGERCYGCSDKLNREVLDSLNILEPFDPAEYGVPATVTKPVLQEALSSRGIVFKKSDKRDTLLKLAWAQPGMIIELMIKCAPDMRTVKEEYVAEAVAWASRNRNLRYVAMALIKHMQSRMIMNDVT